MENQTQNTITLSNGQTVHIVSRVTWGMQEKLKRNMLQGSKINMKDMQSGNMDNINMDMADLFFANHVALSLGIIKIVSEDGTEQQYSQEWMENLDAVDGDLVWETVNAAFNKKK